MPKQTKQVPKAPLEIKVTLSDTAAGIAWLKTLTEPTFRDEVLAQLLASMKKAGAVDAFQNIHGRNDKGIDYLIVESTALHNGGFSGFRSSRGQSLERETVRHCRVST